MNRMCVVRDEEFTRKFRLKLCGRSEIGGLASAGIARPENPSDAAAQLGEGVCKRFAACIPRPESDDGRAAQARVIKLKAEREIQKRPRPTSRRNRREVRIYCEARGDRAVDRMWALKHGQIAHPQHVLARSTFQSGCAGQVRPHRRRWLCYRFNVCSCYFELLPPFKAPSGFCQTINHRGVSSWARGCPLCRGAR